MILLFLDFVSTFDLVILFFSVPSILSVFFFDSASLLFDSLVSVVINLFVIPAFDDFALQRYTCYMYYSHSLQKHNASSIRRRKKREKKVHNSLFDVHFGRRIVSSNSSSRRRVNEFLVETIFIFFVTVIILI